MFKSFFEVARPDSQTGFSDEEVIPVLVDCKMESELTPRNTEELCIDNDLSPRQLVIEISEEDENNKLWCPDFSYLLKISGWVLEFIKIR